MSTLPAQDKAGSATARTRILFAGAASGFAIVLLVALGAGCNTPRWDEPVVAYESFVRAARSGELETAWGALSSESRALITQRAKEMEEASGGSLGEDPKQLVFGARTRPEPAGSSSCSRWRGTALPCRSGRVTRPSPSAWSARRAAGTWISSRRSAAGSGVGRS